MTPQEIKENNILLAEFMGWALVENNSLWKWKDKQGSKICDGGESLKFHNDWNWLMQVIDNIESLDCCDFIKISATYIEIQARLRKGVIFRPTFFDVWDSRIKSTYLACVMFVKWYNQNKGGN